MIRRENRGRRADGRTDGREGRKVGRGQADRRTADGRLFFPVPFLSGHLPSASFLHPFPIPVEKVGFDFCPPFPSLPLFPSFFLPPLSPRRSQAERARGASTNLPFNIRIFIQAAPPPQTLPRDGHSPATAMAWSSSIPLREGLGSLRAGVRSGSERSGSERMPPPRRRRAAAAAAAASLGNLWKSVNWLGSSSFVRAERPWTAADRERPELMILRTRGQKRASQPIKQDSKPI